MLMTTILMTAYLHARKLPLYLTGLFLLVFITIEIIFFSGNVLKIVEGGWFTLVTGLVLFSVMWTWRRARRIKKRYERLTEIEEYFPLRSEEHTSELQSLMRISYAVFCLKKTTNQNIGIINNISS